MHAGHAFECFGENLPARRKIKPHKTFVAVAEHWAVAERDFRLVQQEFTDMSGLRMLAVIEPREVRRLHAAILHAGQSLAHELLEKIAVRPQVIEQTG